MAAPFTFCLGRLFDIRVGVHFSWLFVYGFMTLSIAANIEGVPRTAALASGALCALLLFACVVAHEFAHALVARRFGVRTRAITLFLFGGVATLEAEPPSPRAEVCIALAGPALSALIALGAFGLLAGLERAGASTAVCRVAAYLALANAVLAIFNLIPAFPLDGGRVLRAGLWRLRRSRAAATGAASLVGLGLAFALAFVGIASAVALHALSGLWYVAVAAFVARQSWLQFIDARVAERLERVHVRDVMEAADGDELGECEIALAASATALEAVSAFRTSGRTHIAVVDAGRVAGWLRRERVLAIADRAA